MKWSGLAHIVEDKNENDKYFAWQNKSCTVNRNSWYAQLKISDRFQEILTVSVGMLYMKFSPFLQSGELKN